MIDNSWTWAAANNLLRVNPVHGEEEAKLVLEDWFESNHETGSSRYMEARGEIEDTHKKTV